MSMGREDATSIQFRRTVRKEIPGGVATQTDACHSPMCHHSFTVREEIRRKEVNEEGDVSCCSIWSFVASTNWQFDNEV